MKKAFKFLTAGVLLVSLVFCSACGGDNGGEPAKYFRYETLYPYLGVIPQWTIDTEKGEPTEKDVETWRAICTELGVIDESIAVSYEDSAISRFNAVQAGAEVEIDEAAYNVLSLALEVYEKTGGAYNPAVAGLVDLWGFSPRFSLYSMSDEVQPYDREDYKHELPDSEYIQKFLEISKDFSKVSLSERDGKYYAQKPDCEVEIKGVTYNMQLNLGGIGKGYAVDRAREIILDAGYEYGYFNLGGSSLSVLKFLPDDKGNTVGSVGVKHPRSKVSGETYMSVNAQNVSISTSGDYEQFYDLNGKRYSHIINPFTGYPVNAAPEENGGIICASVFGLTAAEGDAMTTALMVMGKDKAIEYIRAELSEIQVGFIYQDADGSYALYTNMQDGDYTLNDEMEIVKI